MGYPIALAAGRTGFGEFAGTPVGRSRLVMDSTCPTGSATKTRKP
jgi:hypothetical protein